MSRRNKYVGPGSCYARHEGVWVESGLFGVDPTTFFNILALMIRDVIRGYSYDEYCNIIPFDMEHARMRLRFLNSLAYAHMGADDPIVRDVAREMYEVGLRSLEELRIPEPIVVELSGPNAHKVLRELISYGVIKPHQAMIRYREPLAVRW